MEYSYWKYSQKLQLIHFLLYSKRKLLFNSYILTRLDYCCIIWGKYSDSLNSFNFKTFQTFYWIPIDDFPWTSSLSKSTTSLKHNKQHMSKVFTKLFYIDSLMKFIVRIYALLKCLVYTFPILMLKYFVKLSPLWGWCLEFFTPWCKNCTIYGNI